MNVFKPFCVILVLMTISDAAPRSHENILRRGDFYIECDDENFSPCFYIIGREDHLSELCQIEGQIETCVMQVMGDLQCTTIKKESKMAVVMQKLADTNCIAKSECLEKLEEFKNVTSIAFEDEAFCSAIDKAIAFNRYLLDNCKGNFPNLTIISEGFIEILKREKRTLCAQTVPTAHTTATIAIPPVSTGTTKAVTAPPVVTTQLHPSPPLSVTTGKPVYKCFDVFKCPITSIHSLTPSGNLTTGYISSETYFQNVCKYIEELFQCNQYSDFSGCQFLNSVIDEYAKYYGTFCMDAKQKASRVCFYGIKDELFGNHTDMTQLSRSTIDNEEHALAYHSFVNNAARYADQFGGAGHDPIVRSILKDLGALAEQNVAYGCLDQNSHGLDIQWSFFLPAEIDDLSMMIPLIVCLEMNEKRKL